jgi:hypothetical protein
MAKSFKYKLGGPQRRGANWKSLVIQGENLKIKMKICTNMQPVITVIFVKRSKKIV